MRAMKHLFFIGLILTLIFNGCDTINKEIQRSEVTLDTITDIWTFNENGKPVTGTVISEETLENDGTPFIKKRVIKQGLMQKLSGYYKDGKLLFESEYVNGMCEGEQKWYYPSGKIKQRSPYIKNKLNGLVRVYYEDGKVALEKHYKDGLRHGTAKRYYNGLQVKEWVYEMGKEIKSYDFDDYGRKIIPSIELLKSVNYTTGFYLNDNNRYSPAVIMKWKNISDQSVNNVKFECIFFDDDDKEELDKRTDYFSIQPGVTKQLYLQSGYSWHPTRFHYGDPINISCKIFIDGKLYKTIKIKQKSLVSTRM